MSNRWSRRSALRAGGAALLSTNLGLGASAALAKAEMRKSQAPGFYRFMLGAFEVTVLSDGAYPLPTDLLAINQPKEEVLKYLQSNFLDVDQRLSHVNIPLINTGEELILVDVGGGTGWLDGAGRLTENLQASGYAPEDVDKVIVTHGHPDHIWGLIDDFDEPAFPNASYIFSEKEWEFWATKKAVETLPEAFQSFAAGASRRLPIIEDQTTQVKPEKEIASGVFALDTPGHTPGHMSLQVKSGSESLIVTADAITHPYVSFEHPDWWPGTDTDPAMGEKSRRKVLELAATDQSLVLSYHISFPGLGRVARAGNAYRWVPELWRWKV